MFKEFIRNHSGELVVFGIMLGISFAITLAMTGDFGEVLARAGRGRS